MSGHNPEITVKFGVKGDAQWQLLQLPLEDFRKSGLHSKDMLYEDILEMVHVMDWRTYQYPEDVEFDVKSFWYDVVIPSHQALYGIGT